MDLREESERAGDSGRWAFSLIELLVVTSIISLLLGVFVPVAGRAKARARRGACRGQLHSIGMAMRMYVDENSNLMPIAAQLPSEEPNLPTITDVLLPYVKDREVMHCPADRFNLILQYVDPHTRAKLRKHVPALLIRMKERGIQRASPF